MIAPVPADDDRECAVLHSHDDLIDQRADDPLARCRQCRRTRPCLFDIGAQCEQAGSFGLRRRCCRSCGQPFQFLLERLHFDQARIPALFETGRNKTIVGVHRVVLSLRASRLEASLLKRQFNLPTLLGVFGLPLVERIERSFGSRVAEGVRSPRRQRRDRCAYRQRKCSDHRHD